MNLNKNPKHHHRYSDTGRTDLIELQLSNDIQKWREKFGKPVMVTEYGADTIAGFHEVPSYIFTEEYQAELMNENFKVLRKQCMFSSSKDAIVCCVYYRHLIRCASRASSSAK